MFRTTRSKLNGLLQRHWNINPDHLFSYETEKFCHDPPQPPTNGGIYDWNKDSFANGTSPFGLEVRYSCDIARQLENQTLVQSGQDPLYDEAVLKCAWNGKWSPSERVSSVTSVSCDKAKESLDKAVLRRRAMHKIDICGTKNFSGIIMILVLGTEKQQTPKTTYYIQLGLARMAVLFIFTILHELGLFVIQPNLSRLHWLGNKKQFLEHPFPFAKLYRQVHLRQQIEQYLFRSGTDGHACVHLLTT